MIIKKYKNGLEVISFNNNRTLKKYPDGKRYWVKGEHYHSDIGPAYTDTEGHKRWILNGWIFSQKSWLNNLLKAKLKWQK